MDLMNDLMSVSEYGGQQNVPRIFFKNICNIKIIYIFAPVV